MPFGWLDDISIARPRNPALARLVATLATVFPFGSIKITASQLTRSSRRDDEQTPLFSFSVVAESNPITLNPAFIGNGAITDPIAPKPTNPTDLIIVRSRPSSLAQF